MRRQSKYVWSAISKVALHIGKDQAVEIASKAFGIEHGEDSKGKKKDDPDGLSAATRRMYELLGVSMMEDQDEEDLEDVQLGDGGPGSGNFGHKGRPGSVGGSGKGGGKQYRSARAQGLGGQRKHYPGEKTGYGGTRRDWANALTGEQGNRADKLVKKFAAAPPPEGSKAAKSYSATESAEQKIMSEGSTAEKAEWLALKSKARLFNPLDPDSKYTKQCLERLSDDDRKAFDHITSTFGSDPGTGQLSTDLITGCFYDGDYIDGIVAPQVRDYYFSLMSKALDGVDDGMAMPDEVAYSMGLKERPSPTGFKWGDGLSQEHTKTLKDLNDKYGADAKSAGQDITGYVMQHGDMKQRQALCKAYEEKIGWSDYATRLKIRAQNTDEYDRTVFDKRHQLFGGQRYTFRKNLYSMLHAKEMGMFVDHSFDQKIFDAVKKTRDIKTIMAGIAHLGDSSKYGDIVDDVMKPGQALEIDLSSKDPVGHPSTLTGIRIEKRKDGTYGLAMQMGVGTAYSEPAEGDRDKAVNGIKSVVEKLGLVATGGTFSELSAALKPRKQPKTVKPKIAAAYKDVGSLKHVEQTTDRLKKTVFKDVPAADMQAASQVMTRFFQRPDITFSMRINAKDIASILRTNFMSQVQLKDKGMRVHTGGMKDPERRAYASKCMYGTQRVMGVNGQEFEKYGYIGCTDFIKDFDGSGSPGQYGDVIVHFKKDKMYGRTTYTFGDSLGDALSDECCPGFIGENGESTATGCALGKYHASEHISRMADDSAYDLAATGSPSEMYDHSGQYCSYMEAQYHGKLTMQEDVGQICFTQPSDLKMLSKDSKAKFLALGIKVYVKHGRSIDPVDLTA